MRRWYRAQRSRGLLASLPFRASRRPRRMRRCCCAGSRRRSSPPSSRATLVRSRRPAAPRRRRSGAGRATAPVMSPVFSRLGRRRGGTLGRWTMSAAIVAGAAGVIENIDFLRALVESAGDALADAIRLPLLVKLTGAGFARGLVLWRLPAERLVATLVPGRIAGAAYRRSPRPDALPAVPSAEPRTLSS
jgi:hypothetical protein